MKPNTNETQNNSVKTTIVKTETWISKTQSGNGFIIVLDDKLESGDCLTGSIDSLRKFVNNEYKGVNLGVLVKKE